MYQGQNLAANEHISLPSDPRAYNMVEQLKTTSAKIILFDLISTYEVHREVLYDLFKKETIPKNIFATIFSEKLQSIKDCDAISFFRLDKLSKEIIVECLTHFITSMIHDLEIKRAMVDLGSVVNISS